MFKIATRNQSNVASLPKISATLILSRNPVITRDLPAFERQYYLYKNELWKRLMWTFPRWFYFKEGTLSDQRYKELNKPPVFNNPNIEFPSGRPDIKQQRDRRFKQEIKLPKTYKTDENGNEIVDIDSIDNLSRKIIPNSRTTDADTSNNLASLERKLSRTLYLIVKQGTTWKLPSFEVDQTNELIPLHEIAKNGLHRIGGEEINYFNVSSTPCHHLENNSNHEFFIKSHILSGRFEPQNGIEEMWLTKDEMADFLDKRYYVQIKHLLNDV